MKFKAALRSVVVACLLLACSLPFFAQEQEKDKKATASAKLPDFSATEIRGSLKWKIYHSGSRLRVEPSSAAATIWAPDEDNVYNLLILPEKTTCVVMKTAQAQMVRSPLQLVYGSNTTKAPAAAKEVVDGHTCTVLDGVTTLANGNTFRSKIWAADDLKGVPLRIDVYSEPGVVTTAYRDVVLGTPDPALFKLPGKCTPQEKTYQIAPKSNQLPVPAKPPTGQKAPDDKPQ
ncbi:MAG TPA: hypothetical protein VK828_14970 [Terriglobales bacterium]|jgi:hypothetical protein|nr:hypothetical protein [Terriglobales bacterium]